MNVGGWKNWETWNVVMWIDNDEAMYQEKVRFVRTKVVDGCAVEEFVRNLMPHGTPDMRPAPVGQGDNPYFKVDWDEIAEAWDEE